MNISKKLMSLFFLAGLLHELSYGDETCSKSSCQTDDDIIKREKAGQNLHELEGAEQYSPDEKFGNYDIRHNSEDTGGSRSEKNRVADDVNTKANEMGNNLEDDEENITEFPRLSRIEPGKVGDVVNVELEDGKLYERITRAVHPPVFEIPGYLTELECDLIIKLAQYIGLERSGVFAANIEDEFKMDNVDLTEISRVSDQTWLDREDMPPVLHMNLLSRLAKLTGLPLEVLDVSEAIQVVSYSGGGHYHAHLDSSKTSDSGHLPCCLQAPQCFDIDITSEESENCCRICRYITVLYYLNDVDEGGETAFPLADVSDDLATERAKDSDFQPWMDLSHHCYNASLVVKPRRGTAIMWYNHLIDPQNGYLGDTDLRSVHGGCDIIKGHKWIANNWISASPYRDRKRPFPR